MEPPYELALGRVMARLGQPWCLLALVFGKARGSRMMGKVFWKSSRGKPLQTRLMGPILLTP